MALDTAWPWANDTYGLCRLRTYFCACNHSYGVPTAMSWLRALSKGCRCWCWCWCCELAVHVWRQEGAGAGAGRWLCALSALQRQGAGAGESGWLLPEKLRESAIRTSWYMFSRILLFLHVTFGSLQVVQLAYVRGSIFGPFFVRQIATAMHFLFQLTMSWLCALSRQGAGAGCWCWLWCWCWVSWLCAWWKQGAGSGRRCWVLGAGARF